MHIVFAYRKFACIVTCPNRQLNFFFFKYTNNKINAALHQFIVRMKTDLKNRTSKLHELYLSNSHIILS
jgi:hypothetical protein